MGKLLFTYFKDKSGTLEKMLWDSARWRLPHREAKSFAQSRFNPIRKWQLATPKEGGKG